MRVLRNLKGVLFLLIIVTSLPFMFVSGESKLEQTAELNAVKDWTVLVYLCGDNNLETFALDDLNEMEAAGGTTADVNIVAMVDRCFYDYESYYGTGYTNDWSETRYYTIVGDSNPSTFTSPMNVSLGEQNMGLAQTLDDFIDWGLTYYPADKTALIIWDHGGGLDGVCWDEDNNDNMLIHELSTALEGYHFDYLGFDACVMGQFEVLYEMRNFCDIYVSSMLSIPGDGWDYYNTFFTLLNDPTMTAGELAQHTCEDYVAYYSGYASDVTLSAYDTSALAGIESIIDNFSLEMINALDTHAQDIYDLRMSVDSELFPDIVCDMMGIAENAQLMAIPSLASSATELESALDAILYASESSFIEDPYGLRFFMPALPYDYYNDFYVYSNQSIVNLLQNEYYSLDFVENTLWDNFLVEWEPALETVSTQISTISSITEPLVEGSIRYFYADLPYVGPDYAYEATLAMDYGADFDLHVWSEEYFFGLPDGFYVYSDAYGSDTEQILIVVEELTRVFFMVLAYEGTGNFILELEVVEYTDDIYEENDYVYNAAPIDINTIYDLIASDDDFFEVELIAGLPIDISLDFNSEVTDLDLYLIASDQETYLAASDSYYYDEYISYTPTYTGTYFVEVDYWDGLLGGSYLLEVAVADIAITSLIHTPSSPQQGDTIAYSCNIASLNPIVEVTLGISYDGDTEQYFAMNDVGTYYFLELTPPEGIEEVEYSVYIEDDQGNSITSTTKSFTFTTSFLSFPWYIVPFMLIGLAGLSQFLSKKR